MSNKKWMNGLGIMLILSLLMVMVVAVLPVEARRLPQDLNGNVMQFGSQFSCLTVTASADTVWKKVEIPAGTYEILMRGTGGALKVAADSVYATIKYEYELKDTLGVVVLPCLSMTRFYIRRAAAGTAAGAYLILRRF